MHFEQYKIDVEWHFTATAHGKNSCDAMTALVKRSARVESLKPGKVIQNLQQMYDFCRSKCSSHTLQIMMVKKEEVQRFLPMLENRYKNASRLRGIQQCHSFVPIKGTMSVQVRKFSSCDEYEIFHPFPCSDDLPLDSVVTTNFTIGTIVTILVNSTFHLGKIKSVDEEKGIISVSFMKRVRDSNKFCWPEPAKLEDVDSTDILSTIERMLSLPSEFYALRSKDLKRNNRLLSMKLKAHAS